MKRYIVTMKNKRYGNIKEEFTWAENKREARKNFSLYASACGWKIQSVEE